MLRPRQGGLKIALHQIARQIRQRGADHLLAVNGNQPRLREPLEDAFADQPDTVARESNTTGHGRQTQQIAQVLSNTGHVDAQRGTDYRSRGRVLSLRIVNGQARRIEQRYYISSAELDTESCAGMVPRHWAVENDLHWRLDVALREDAWVVRRDHAPENPKHCCATHIRSIRTTPTGGRTRPSPLG